MNCLYCQGRMEKGTAVFHLDRKGYHVSLDSVSAWVCTQCGQPYFEGEQVDAIQRAANALERELSDVISGKSA